MDFSSLVKIKNKNDIDCIRTKKKTNKEKGNKSIAHSQL